VTLKESEMGDEIQKKLTKQACFSLKFWQAASKLWLKSPATRKRRIKAAASAYYGACGRSVA
jgi:hypothetical protein